MEYSLTLADVDKPKLARVEADKKDKDKGKTADAAVNKGADVAKGADAAKADKADAKASGGDAADADDDELDDDGGTGTAKADAVDPIKTESLNILEDLIEQQRRVKLATTAHNTKG